MIVAVNATAARESGAQTILRQFLNALASYRGDDRYIIFIPEQLDFAPMEGVEFVKVDTSTWCRRIRWDKSGFRRCMKEKGISPDVIFSMQNTGVNYDLPVPQYIYYHQLLPLSEHRWNPFKSSERLYFLYKHVYRLFVQRSLRRADRVIVQLDSTKTDFLRVYRYPADRVEVVRPDIPQHDFLKVPKTVFDDGKVHLFFPAKPLPYKNHIVIVRAMEILAREGLAGRFMVHFSIGADDRSTAFVREIFDKRLEKSFAFEGMMPFEKVFSYYRSVDALLFPSYIESFGLPLIEAASAGLKVICSDLPYAREVLAGYRGATFVPYDDARAWAENIKGISGVKNKLLPLSPDAGSQWEKVFRILHND